MSSVVFILGAGASRQAGAPLMHDFLDVASNLWKRGEIDDEEDRDHFRRVFEGLGRLQHVHSKAQLDIQNLESVFSAFEMAQTLGGFGGFNRADMEALSRSMNRLIVVTLEKTLLFPVGGDGSLRPPEPYKDFAQRIKYILSEARPKQTVSVITFNYDLAVDYALFVERIPFSYHLAEGRHSDVPLLKLHGSLNWGVRKSDGKIVPWELAEYMNVVSQIFVRSSAQVPLLTGARMKDREGTTGGFEVEPVIVPPTWNKASHSSQISMVWARAATELSEAENIFVIGYSLPETDLFFRHLYALGSVGSNPLKRFWVMNPDNSGKTQERFEGLLGPGARGRFLYLAKKFGEAIPEIPVN